MKEPSYADAFEVLCLQAADSERGPVLFGEDCLARARSAVRPFMVGNNFPSIYLEFPLMGDPFLDVTVLYNKIGIGTRIHSEAAAGTEPVLDFFARECDEVEGVSFGFELDTSKEELPQVAIHFQPRTHTELVKPFCESVGEPERARMYLDQSQRMPDGWSLSFFGMFRGRPESPLRVCGYLSSAEDKKCAEDPGRIARAFDQIGFSAYDDQLVEQVATLMGTSFKTTDFQFDVHDDGSVGDTFAIDVAFEAEQAELVHDSFSDGPAARIMRLYESWGITDDRWRLVPDTAFARALPASRADGSTGKFAFTLMPGWSKVRWKNGIMQPAKYYLLGKGGWVEGSDK